MKKRTIIELPGFFTEEELNRIRLINETEQFFDQGDWELLKRYSKWKLNNADKYRNYNLP